MVLFVFQFYPVCNYGKIISFGFRTAKGVEGLIIYAGRSVGFVFILFDRPPRLYTISTATLV